MVSSVHVAFVNLQSFTLMPTPSTDPVITVDAFGNIFQNNVNTGQQLAGFVANNPTLAPLVDGAWRERLAAVANNHTTALAAERANAEALRAELETTKKELAEITAAAVAAAEAVDAATAP